MSLEALSDFIHAAEHSSSLRRALKNCADIEAILVIANNYGFKVNQKDLMDGDIAFRIKDWFKRSQINPINKN